MARRRGKPGAYLMSDDYTGFTVTNDKIQKDYWNNLVVNPLKRNLQEIASPLGDPFPVSIFRGAQYEQTNACDFETSTATVGTTTVPTRNNLAIEVMGWNPGIGTMSVGCTFRVS